MRRTAALLALAATLAGCSDSSGPGGSNGGSAFDISISGGLNPTYSWPGGTAQSLSVVRVSAPGTIVWGLAHLQQALPSPVTHGTASGGAVVTLSTEPRLTAGVRYRVTVTRQDTRTGFKEFTP